MITNEKLIGLSFVKLGLGLFKKKLKIFAVQLFHHGKRLLKKSLKAPNYHSVQAHDESV